MPRRCSICAHDKRADVEALLLEGVPLRNISERFSVSPAALSRHNAEHIPAQLSRAHDAGEVAAADSLLDQVRGLQHRTLAILEAAQSSRENRTALSAIGEARRNLELLAKLTQQLGDGSTTVNNYFIGDRVQTLIVEALEPYPDASLAVSEALGELEESTE